MNFKFKIGKSVLLTVTGRLGSALILPITVPVTIGIMLNFDGNCDGDGHSVRICEHSKHLVRVTCCFGFKLSIWVYPCPSFSSK